MRNVNAKLKTSVLLLGLTLVVFACSKETSKESLKQYQQAFKVYEQKDTDRALDMLQAILKESPEFVQARIMAGRVYYFRGDFDAAEVYLERAANDDPANIDALLWLAKAQSSKPEKNDIALKTLDRLLDKDSSHLEAWFLKGLLLERKNDLNGALSAYRYAVNRARTLSLVHLRLSVIYQKAELPDMSKSELERALLISRFDPNFAKEIKVRAAQLSKNQVSLK